MKRKGILFYVFLIILVTAPNAVYAGTTERVSVSSYGIQGNSESHYPSISADGRYVAFYSGASNLVTGDTNGTYDIFVHDRVTGTIEMVSVSSDGIQGNSGSYYPSISTDGRYVAFYSGASNLVPGDTNGAFDIFVHDRVTRITERVSVSSGGVQGNGNNSFPSISADGRYVAFMSYASNLVLGDTNGTSDIFVHDRVTRITERVSVSSGGVQGNSWSGYNSISGGGRFVAFASWASNLVLGDTNGITDVFVYDRVTRMTERVSVNSAGIQGNGGSWSNSISADGRFVAFYSWASNLVFGDTNGLHDVFVHDRVTGVTERVSVNSAGIQGNGGSWSNSISADGRFVAFYSGADNFVPEDTNGTYDIFVHDRMTGTTERVSVSSYGIQGNSASSSPSISADGRFVAFASLASNLVPGDTNGTSDIFVHDRVGDTIPPTTITTFSGIPGDNGWYISNVQVTLTAVDNEGGSGVNKTEYSFDGTTWNIYSVPFVISNEGTTTVYYKSTDNAGNVETSKSISVKIDKISPTTSAVISGTSGSNGWYVSDVTIELMATDTVSGVKAINYSINGVTTTVSGDKTSITLTADGRYDITYYAIDNAGNIEAQKSMSINIDRTAPTITTVTATPNVLWPPNHKMVDVRIDGSAIDDMSGIASVVITVTDEYGIYNMTIPQFGSTIQLEAWRWREGTDKGGRVYTITVVATDMAGNQSTATTQVIVPHDMRK